MPGVRTCLSWTAPKAKCVHRKVSTCIQKYETQLSLLESEKRALARQLAKAQDAGIAAANAARAEVLEKAMQSLVRLCVVTLTVNVHLGNEDMACKPAMPRDTIRVISKSILPKFSQIFVQDRKGYSPDDEEPLETWLESLLEDMQESIEGHLRGGLKTMER